VRFLVVLPPDRASNTARFHDLERDDVAIGEELLIDDLLVRVQNVVDVAAGEGYDATLICTVETGEPVGG
jgi:hypothetical protein